MNHSQPDLGATSNRLVGIAAAGVSVLLIAAVTLHSYRNSFSGVFLLDDQSNIVDNAQIRELYPLSRHLSEGGSRRLTQLSLALNYAYAGLNPGSYHRFNFIVHCLASVALFALTFFVSKVRNGSDGSKWAPFGIALSVALMWAVHPLNTQAVTYIVQRAESMAGLMLFLFLLFYGYAALAMASPNQTEMELHSQAGRWKIFSLFGLAFIAFLAGVLCKETMAMALPMAMVYDRAIFTKSWKDSARSRGLFWLACCVPLAVAVPIVWPSLFSSDSTAGFNMKSISWWEYVRTQPQVLLHYLGLAVIPYPQCFDYGWPPEKRTWVIVVTGSIMIMSMVTLAACFRRYPWWCFWGIAIALFLVPTSLIPLQDIAVEHRMYVPLAFLLIPCATWVNVQMGRVDATIGRLIGVVSVTVVVACFSWLTIARNATYGSATSMWQDVIGYVEQHGRESMWLGRAYANLGESLAAEGKWENSIDASEKALDNRGFPVQVHGNLVRAYIATNRLNQAQHHLAIALSMKPDSARLIQQAGLIAAMRRDYSNAITHFERAASLAPKDVIIKDNLARALAQAGRSLEAVEIYRDAIRIDSQHVEGYRRLIELLIDRNEIVDAAKQVEVYRERFPKDDHAIWLSGLVRLLAGDARTALNDWSLIKHDPPPRFHFFRGNAYLKLGKIDMAISDYEAELVQNPKSVETLLNLGGVFAASAPSKAEAYYDQVIKLAPNYLDARFNLAVVQLKLNKMHESKANLDGILKINPKFEPALKLMDLLNKNVSSALAR